MENLRKVSGVAMGKQQKGAVVAKGGWRTDCNMRAMNRAGIKERGRE